jgi:hypothetical protein
MGGDALVLPVSADASRAIRPGAAHIVQFGSIGIEQTFAQFPPNLLQFRLPRCFDEDGKGVGRIVTPKSRRGS